VVNAPVAQSQKLLYLMSEKLEFLIVNLEYNILDCQI